MISTAEQTTTTSGGPRRVDIGGLQFDLPMELRYQADGWTSSMESVSAFYSNVELGAACQVSGNSGSCGWPLQTLPAGAIVVSWGNTSGLGAPLGSTVPNESIGGQPATVTIDKPGVCGNMHSDETITALTVQAGSSGDYKIQACLRGPNLARSEQLVTAMLASVSIG
jgi:hypothetical protein